MRGDTLYLLSGGRERSDWVRNLIARADVEVRLGDHSYAAKARVVGNANEDALARRLLLEKYSLTNGNLSGWGRSALPIAIDLPAG
jgi:hypothetical protein